MGIAALKKHIEGQIHLDNVRKVKNFFFFNNNITAKCNTYSNGL